MPEIEKHGPSEAPRFAAEIESIQIAEWCPTPDGSGPADQIHVLLKVRGYLHPLVLRIKSGPAADAIIDALVEHRTNVFGARK